MGNNRTRSINGFKFRAFLRIKLNFIHSLLYLGNNVNCPCCKGNFNKFLLWDPSDPKDENLICPRCNSHSRHRTILLYLQRETKIFSSQGKMLHFAPEPFFIPIFKSQHNIDYVTGDLNPVFADNKIDITNISFSNNFFDFILCLHVLEHIVDDEKAMRELFRVLKPGSFALIQVPIDLAKSVTFEDTSITTEADRLNFFGQVDHVRICGTDYYKRLEQVGFSVETCNYSDVFSNDDKRKFGLTSREDFYICRKP